MKFATVLLRTCGYLHKGLTYQDLRAPLYATWSAFRLRGRINTHYTHAYTLVPRIAKQALKSWIPVADTYMHGILLNPNVLMFAFLVTLR